MQRSIEYLRLYESCSEHLIKDILEVEVNMEVDAEDGSSSYLQEEETVLKRRSVSYMLGDVITDESSTWFCDRTEDRVLKLFRKCLHLLKAEFKEDTEEVIRIFDQ